MAGIVLHTLVLTDVATGWTECVPLIARYHSLIVEALEQVRKRLPFPLRAFDTDNDAAFINQTVLNYCRQTGLEFTRSRAGSGASTGAAAALIAAAHLPEILKAVVSRGGRPDLAGSALSRVKAPTPLIVGREDTQVIDLNRKALDELQCEKELEIVPGASHLFEEPGTVEQVSKRASAWFDDHFQRFLKQGVQHESDGSRRI